MKLPELKARPQHQEYMTVREALDRLKLATEVDPSDSWKESASCAELAALRNAGWKVRRFRVNNGWLISISEPA